MGAGDVDQANLVPGLCQAAAEQPTHGPSSDDGDFHVTLPIWFG